MAEHHASWVYAVVPAAPAPPLPEVTGVGGAPVRLVVQGDIAAVAGPVDAADVEEEALRHRLNDPAWLEHAARSHHRVVTRCFDTAPTVPFRLATVYHDDGRVAEMLAQRAPELTGALTTVAGRAEWGVQAFTALAAEQDEQPPRVEGDPTRPGTEYLMRRRAQRSAAESVRQSAAGAAEAVHGALQRLAVAASRHPPANRTPPGGAGLQGPMVLNAAYLVGNHQRDEFAEIARELGQLHRALRLRVTGPWPAYSFVEISEEVTAG